jgi:cyclase
MLKIRVIPTLLWKNLGLVKGVGFDSWRRLGAVLPSVKVYNTRQVDELVFVDIAATGEGREPDYESVAEFSAECFVPLTVGGGVRSVEHVRKLLLAGADKVAINSSAYENPQLIRDTAQRFGAQCVVVSIDVRRSNGKYECYSQSGAQATGRDPVAWAKEVEACGAGEILLTSVERDGTMEGYDLDLIRQVSSAVKIPVIASGGAGNYEHMYAAIAEGKASALAAASMFHFTEQTPIEAKRFLASKGLPVRRGHTG